MEEFALPVIQARVGRMEISKECERCEMEVENTPVDQVAVCPSCGQLYYVQYPPFLFDFFTFEKQLFSSTMIEYLSQNCYPEILSAPLEEQI